MPVSPFTLSLGTLDRRVIALRAIGRSLCFNCFLCLRKLPMVYLLYLIVVNMLLAIMQLLYSVVGPQCLNIERKT